jgi:hypothetical protein
MPEWVTVRDRQPSKGRHRECSASQCTRSFLREARLNRDEDGVPDACLGKAVVKRNDLRPTVRTVALLIRPGREVNPCLAAGAVVRQIIDYDAAELYTEEAD